MASWDMIFPEVRPLVPTLNVLAIRRAARTAARRMCTETGCWKKNLTITLTAGSREQDVSSLLPDGSVIYAIASDPRISSDGQRIRRTSQEELDTSRLDWRNDTAAKPEYCFRSSPTEISFVPTPSSGIDVDLRAILMPSKDSTTIDDNFMEDYWEVLTLGTLAIASNAPAEPWYDPGNVQNYALAFNVELLRLKAHGNDDTSAKAGLMTYGGI